MGSLQVAHSDSAIRPRSDSEVHVYFGRVTAVQTAIDHAGVAPCATVCAGQAGNPARWTSDRRLPGTDIAPALSAATAALAGVEWHVGDAGDCRIGDSARESAP